MKPARTWGIAAAVFVLLLAGLLYLLAPMAGSTAKEKLLASAHPVAASPATLARENTAMKVQNTATTALLDEIQQLSQQINSLPAEERQQAATQLVARLKQSVQAGAGVRETFQQIEQLTPYMETDANRLEGLNFSIWQELRQLNAANERPPTAQEQQQLQAYTLAADKIVRDVSSTTPDRAEQHRIIDARLLELRRQIFGEDNPRVLQR